MPVVGSGLQVLIAHFFARRPARSGQPLDWLFILFFFAPLGSRAHFFSSTCPTRACSTGPRRP